MKNKGTFFVFITLFFCLFLASFLENLTNYLISPLLYLFSEAKNIDILAILFEYLLYGIVYFIYGSLLMMILYVNLNDFKKLIIYSILICLATIAFFMMIRSFFTHIDFIKYGFRGFIALISEFITFLILNKRTKKNQN